MEKELIRGKIEKEGILLSEIPFKEGRLFSVFSEVGKTREIRWKEEILKIKAAGEVRLIFKDGIEGEILITKIDNQSKRLLKDDDIFYSLVVNRDIFIEKIEIEKLPSWEINGKTMYGKYLYEALYEFITGEIEIIEENKILYAII